MDNFLANFSEKQRNQAYKRYTILKPFLENGVQISVLAIQSGFAYRTLSRWINRYRKDGLLGLIDKERTKSKNSKIDKDIKNFIEGMALQKPSPSIASIHRKVVSIAKTKGLHVPSYSSVYNIVKNIKPSLLKLSQDGTKAYKDKYDLLYPRKSTYPNEIWQADHMKMDIILINHKGKPQRPWLTVIMDDYSRCIAGYYLTFESPSSQNTSLALHQAIWYKKNTKWNICGIPDTFYTDHGSDFTSQHLEQVSADIKMKLSFSLVAQPRGRGIIERFFRTINQVFLSEILGYLPSGKPENRPELELKDLDKLLKDFLIYKYNQSVHSSTNEIPQERWKKGNFIPRLPDKVEKLDLLLLTESKSRKVHQDGIYFQTLKYIDTNLAAYVGETVLIRYNPRDIAEIRVFYKDKFICRAVSDELAGKNISLKDFIKARNKVRKDLKEEIKDKSKIIDEFLNSHYENGAIEEKQKSNDTKKRKLKRYIHE